MVNLLIIYELKKGEPERITLQYFRKLLVLNDHLVTWQTTNTVMRNNT